MLLALDIGNTNITLGVFRGDELIMLSRLESGSRRMADQYAVEIKGILDINNISITHIDGAIICSVVPPLTAAIRSAICRLTGISPIIVDSSVYTKLKIKIYEPASLGADFIAGAVAAKAKYKCPSVVFDLGSATTMAVLDREGAFIGASILAGIRLSLDALASGTAQLPQIDLEEDGPLIGKNSKESLHSGALYGTAAIIDGLSRGVAEALSEECTVVVTGGLSRLAVPLCTCKPIIDENLLMDGMLIIYKELKGS